MRLIGVLESPYVRRVAVSLKLLGLPFEHEPLSVFRNYEAFAAINPAVKAPTLVTDEGVVLLESTLILEHLDRLAKADRRLAPPGLADHARAQRIIGLALAACEKMVQIVYETELRPPAARHAPWLERIRGQLAAGLRLLDAEVETPAAWLFGERPLQADVTAAVVWSFARHAIPAETADIAVPALARLAERAEALAVFASTPISRPD
jgi:glutathione S-transferase